MSASIKTFFLLSSLILSLVSCGFLPDLPVDSVSTVAESEECLTTTFYSPSVGITGTAGFYKRGLDVTTAGANVVYLNLKAPIATALPVKFAEIRVLDSSGNTVQCGKTDSAGNIKAADGTSTLTISTVPGTYTIELLSRSHHTMAVPVGKTPFEYYVSVKKDIYNNVIHSVSSSIISAGSGTYATTLTAFARESESSEVSGGAFNIYNNLITTYEYLAQNTSTSDLTCLSSKFEIFWQAGFNPAQYLYPDVEPADLGNLSYYLKGANQLFINGGKLGNVASADTDHFDDAVIIHELGHHIEDVCGKMDSPGGAHSGLFRIDPRLAWSEGWGNFFGAHIIKKNLSAINPDAATDLTGYGDWLYYLDTVGYSEGSNNHGSELIRLNLTKAGNNPEASSGFYFDKVDAAAYPGEGHFREISIARSLFKMTNTCVSTCTNADYFPQMWKAFEKVADGIGMGKSDFPYRSSVRFYNRLNQVFAGNMPAGIDSILNTDEAQQRDGNAAYSSGGFKTWVPYATKLVTSTTGCNLKIQPRSESYSVTHDFSDQRYSNHFYYFDLSTLKGILELHLNVSKVAGSNTDFDLILFQENYRYVNDTCLVYDSSGTCTQYIKTLSSSEFVRSDRSTQLYPKSLRTLNTLDPATPYLLNVRAFTAGMRIASNTEYTYTLTNQSGDYLCPSSNF